MKTLLVAAALATAAACATSPLIAQTGTNSVEVAEPAVSLELPPYRPWTIGLGFGTDAIFGGGVSWRFSDHFGARAGAGYSETSEDVELSGLNFDAELRLLVQPLTLDYYPWKKHSFRVSLGVMFNENELSGGVSQTGTIIVGGQPITVPPGSLTMSIKQQLVNPYLSIGGNLFYFDRAHHWALAGELGVAYTGEVRVSVDRSGSSNLSDETLNKVKDELNDYADDYVWWPVVKVALTYSF